MRKPLCFLSAFAILALASCTTLKTGQISDAINDFTRLRDDRGGLIGPNVRLREASEMIEKAANKNDNKDGLSALRILDDFTIMGYDTLTDDGLPEGFLTERARALVVSVDQVLGQIGEMDIIKNREALENLPVDVTVALAKKELGYYRFSDAIQLNDLAWNKEKNTGTPPQHISFLEDCRNLITDRDPNNARIAELEDALRKKKAELVPLPAQAPPEQQQKKSTTKKLEPPPTQKPKTFAQVSDALDVSIPKKSWTKQSGGWQYRSPRQRYTMTLVGTESAITTVTLDLIRRTGVSFAQDPDVVTIMTRLFNVFTGAEKWNEGQSKEALNSPGSFPPMLGAYKITCTPALQFTVVLSYRK